MAELNQTPGKALAALRAGHGERLCALNLSASFEGRASDGVCHHGDAFDALVTGLLEGNLAARL